MKVFTIESGQVVEGAKIEMFKLSGGMEIPAILVGEKGRGRKLGVLPIGNTPDKNLIFATVGKTRSGRPKLIATAQTNTEKVAIVVFRTKIGFRGGNNHTGDRVAMYWVRNGYSNNEYEEAGIPLQDKYIKEEVQKYSLKYVAVKYGDGEYHRWDTGFKREIVFAEFPAEILIEGTIAQGGAGRMGWGTQMVAIIKRGVIFRTSYTGRLYGAPSAHYYMFDGEKIRVATWHERELTDDAVFE